MSNVNVSAAVRSLLRAKTAAKKAARRAAKARGSVSWQDKYFRSTTERQRGLDSAARNARELAEIAKDRLAARRYVAAVEALDALRARATAALFPA